MHAWFALTSPATREQLEAWHTHHEFGDRVDKAIFRAVQPIYSSDPELAPGIVADLEGRRLVRLRGDRECVDLAPTFSIIDEIPAAKAAEKPRLEEERANRYVTPTPTRTIDDPTLQDVADALSFIAPPRERDSWLGIVFDVRAIAGEDGDSLAREWSARDPDPFDPQQFDRDWRSANGSPPPPGKDWFLFSVARWNEWRPRRSSPIDLDAEPFAELTRRWREEHRRGKQHRATMARFRSRSRFTIGWGGCSTSSDGSVMPTPRGRSRPHSERRWRGRSGRSPRMFRASGGRSLSE